ncbi:EXOSC1 [Scenedesmus sp. PABB004]|nr:EXOSC1 [Scenedesmus sp. PABB004]
MGGGGGALVCVGDRLGAADEWAPGPGTYVRGGGVYASIVGAQAATPGEGGRPGVLAVVARGAAPVVPEAGSIVIAKVTKVSPTAAHARIVCCGAQALDAHFTGVVRQQDVRGHEVDKVVMADCFRPGDTVRARVLSLGDARSYYLTTADNALGVVHAKSLAGAAMVPISWQEMQCPQTKLVERRKVAKVD